MIRIASSVPGRMRLRGAPLHDPSVLDHLSGRIASWRHVAAVEANPRSGSLLVRYDAARLDRACCEQRALAAAANVLGTTHVKVGAGETAQPAPRHGAPSRVKANRWAKRGMLASLATSLLLAAVGSKRWHALTGVLFLHALAVHLWVHRRHILR
jgi:hypothetical protein